MSMTSLISKWLILQDAVVAIAKPILPVVLRLWVAKAFFLSGLTKIKSWSGTVALFEYEYTVPLLSPNVAALLATGVELAIPVLLVLGLMSRLSATILFVFNIVAAISYPDISAAGTLEHMLWGLMLLVIMVYGAGIFSADHWLRKKMFGSKS